MGHNPEPILSTSHPYSVESTFCIYFMAIIQDVSPLKMSVYVPLP
jgi:hypothetical protein